LRLQRLQDLQSHAKNYSAYRICSPTPKTTAPAGFALARQKLQCLQDLQSRAKNYSAYRICSRTPKTTDRPYQWNPSNMAR